MQRLSSDRLQPRRLRAARRRHQNTQFTSFSRRRARPLIGNSGVESDPCRVNKQGGNLMTSRNRSSVSRVEAKRSNRSVIIGLAALMAVAGMLGGCVVETPGHPYHGWWWHHHE